MVSEFLRISPRISVLPVIHGSGDFAVEVRRVMLSESFDCLAVPLPPSFQEDVESGIRHLPGISAVVQTETVGLPFDLGPDDDDDDSDERNEPSICSYVPIDPCQPVIAALRIAIQERMPRTFIDLETDEFVSIPAVLPDPYALKKVPIERFAAAVLPAIPRPSDEQVRHRVIAMANRLRELETRHRSILLVCSIMEWPWIKEAYFGKVDQEVEDDQVEDTRLMSVTRSTLPFFLGELPYVTGLYERARAQLDDDENLSIDGIKQLVLAARGSYKQEYRRRARRITPKMLSLYFKYIRNLTLIERRLTPDLFTLVQAAQQIAGDGFAIHLAETSREYPYEMRIPFPPLAMGIGEVRFPNGNILEASSRLPGHSLIWRRCELKPRPPKIDQTQWRMRWDPLRQCSWPDEDVAIERFRTHVTDAALAIMGADLARTEKFTTSLKDGLDIRETLRNWHTGDLYVKIMPPSRGRLDCVLMFFDSPADPRDYPWRTTWMAEHDDESTLALFATDYRKQMVGPGIGLAVYGGGMFLYPPIPIRDIWLDRRFNGANTLEDRLLGAACYYSRESHIAVLSYAAPGAAWRRIARRYGKKLVHVPLSRFSQTTVQQLRLVHVLNGQEVRSFAAHFIRKI